MLNWTDLALSALAVNLKTYVSPWTTVGLNFILLADAHPPIAEISTLYSPSASLTAHTSAAAGANGAKSRTTSSGTEIVLPFSLTEILTGCSVLLPAASTTSIITWYSPGLVNSTSAKPLTIASVKVIAPSTLSVAVKLAIISAALKAVPA